MAYAQGFIYVFGGCTTHSTAFNDLWRLDLSNAKWSRLSQTGKSQCPLPKAGPTLTFYSKNLILCGGYKVLSNETTKSEMKCESDIHFYDLNTSTWIKPENVANEVLTLGHGACCIGNQLYVTCNSYENSVWRFVVKSLNLDTLEWKTIRTFGAQPAKRSHHSQLALSNRVLIFGGLWQEYGNIRPVPDAYFLCLDTSEWTKITISVNPSDICIKWNAPLIQVGDCIVAFAKKRIGDGYVRFEESSRKIQIQKYSDIEENQVPSENISEPINDATQQSTRVFVPPDRAMTKREKQLYILRMHEQRLRELQKKAVPSKTSEPTWQNKKTLTGAKHYKPALICTFDANILKEENKLQRVEVNLELSIPDLAFFNAALAHCELVLFGGLERDEKEITSSTNGTYVVTMPDRPV
ncbi:DgyrCDS6349 [Dimorphilus gyrociliatus]|uniref:DgyrCDS6349 n=1 Tax=Dimorphilus gyrociliatus TaxID=2664684 RepID=A0A7I8VQL0_9ANNE|nr:DgyrCDS6349 [Dimorphilus gyrociliatus]